MGLNKSYKPGQLVTIEVDEVCHVYRITKASSIDSVCEECEEANGPYDPCCSINCSCIPIICYPKLVEQCKKQT